METLLPLLLIPTVVNTIILCILGGLIIKRVDTECEKTKVELKKIHAKLDVHTVE